MKRDMEPKLLDLLTNMSIRETIILEGARQVGKSHLALSVLQQTKIPYVAFDLEKEKRLLGKINHTEDFFDFKRLMEDQFGVKSHSILFLDEAQEAPKLARYIKSFKEDWPHVKVLLTGSSMNRLFDSTVRIPVGRKRSMCVFGFSFVEFLRFVDKSELAEYLKTAPEKIEKSRHNYLVQLFDAFCKVGGYPEAVKAYAHEYSFTDIIEEIYFSLEDDFKRKEDYQPEIFESAISAVANFIGTPSKLTSIDTTKYHAKKILESLKALHLVLEVRQQALNPVHSSFLPKRYLHDIGLCNLRRSIAVPSLSILETIDPLMRTPLGGLFENAVIINLLSGESASKSIGTWKKGGNNDIEVDFLYDYAEKGIKIPIECKAALSVKSRHLKNVKHYLDLTGQRFGVVVSAAPFEYMLNNDRYCIINLPVYLVSRKNIRSYCDRN